MWRSRCRPSFRPRLLNEGVRLGSQLDTTATLELYEKAACIRVNGSVMVWADTIEGQYPRLRRRRS